MQDASLWRLVFIHAFCDCLEGYFLGTKQYYVWDFLDLPRPRHKFKFPRNIAAGTTDLGYWVQNLSTSFSYNSRKFISVVLLEFVACLVVLKTFSVSHTFLFWHQGAILDLWPLKHLIRVMRRHDLTKNIARIANAVHCHSWWSGNKDCHEFRFSIVRIVISVSIVTSLQDCLVSQLWAHIAAHNSNAIHNCERTTVDSKKVDKLIPSTK